MSESFKLNMKPILEWMAGHVHRNFYIRRDAIHNRCDNLNFDVVLTLEDSQWRGERRVALESLKSWRGPILDWAVEAMLETWATHMADKTNLQGEATR